MEHTKQALFLLPLLIRRPCRLCLLGVEWNEKILKWLREGVPYHQIADNLTAAGHRCVPSQVSKHKQHLLKALTFQTDVEQHPSQLEALQLQLRIEKEKRAQLELEREKEERQEAQKALEKAREGRMLTQLLTMKRSETS